MEVIIPKLEESGHDLNWYGGLLEMKVCDSVMFQYVPIGHGSPHVPKSHLKFLAIQLFINQDCWSSPYSGWSLWIPIWCLVLGCSFPHNDGWLVAWTPLKNMSSSVGMIIPNIWKHKKCSKPPTRWCLYETNTHTHCWPRILSTRSQPAKFPIWVETDLWRPIRPTKSQWTNASTGCQFQTFSLEKVPFDAYWRDRIQPVQPQRKAKDTAANPLDIPQIPSFHADWTHTLDELAPWSKLKPPERGPWLRPASTYLFHHIKSWLIILKLHIWLPGAPSAHGAYEFPGRRVRSPNSSVCHGKPCRKSTMWYADVNLQFADFQSTG